MPVYHVRCTCAADYNARRLPYRPAHLAQLTGLRDDGRVVGGGPEPDGELRFRRPDGRSLPDVPSPPSVAHDPVHVLRARHESQGLWIHARTAMPGWLGERLDVGWAIDVLHPLAARTQSELPAHE